MGSSPDFTSWLVPSAVRTFFVPKTIIRVMGHDSVAEMVPSPDAFVTRLNWLSISDIRFIPKASGFFPISFKAANSLSACAAISALWIAEM